MQGGESRSLVIRSHVRSAGVVPEPPRLAALSTPPNLGGQFLLCLFVAPSLCVNSPPMQLAQKMSRIGTESAFEVLVKARALEKQGKNIIHLEIGEPDFPTPAHIIEAGKRALDEGWTKYGPTAGFPEFREIIAAYVSRTRRIKVDAEN